MDDTVDDFEEFTDEEIAAAEDSYVGLQVSMWKELRTIRRLEVAARERAIDPRVRDSIKGWELFEFEEWLLHDDPSYDCEYADLPSYPANQPLCPDRFVDTPDFMKYGASRLFETSRLVRRAVIGPSREAASSQDAYGGLYGASCDTAPVTLRTPYALLTWHWNLHLGSRPRVIAARIVHGVQKAAAAGMDEVVIFRGGGDSEVFAAFEDPAVIEAVRHCPLSTIVALGHTPTATDLDEHATAVFAVPGNISQLDRLRFRIGSRHGESAEHAIRDLLSLVRFGGHG